MKKKGFTLVELLAVIAILAILVIMALPAVLRMYRQARINTFENEVKQVYRTAQTSFLNDVITIGAGGKVLYTDGSCTLSGATVKPLEMTGNSKFHYYVVINVKGEVEEIRAANGTYSYKSTGTDLKVENIEVQKYADYEKNISNICSGS